MLRNLSESHLQGPVEVLFRGSHVSLSLLLDCGRVWCGLVYTRRCCVRRCGACVPFCDRVFLVATSMMNKLVCIIFGDGAVKCPKVQKNTSSSPSSLSRHCQTKCERSSTSRNDRVVAGMRVQLEFDGSQNERAGFLRRARRCRCT